MSFSLFPEIAISFVEQNFGQRNLIVDEIFLQFSRMLVGIFGLPFVRWLIALPLDESATN